MNRLRISHIIIQPVLVWDDGEELTPFEKQVQPVQIPLSKFSDYEKKLKEDIEKIEKGVI